MDRLQKQKTSESPQKNRIIGYICGITAGIAFGLNPFFGLPLLQEYELSVNTVLLCRYEIGMLLLGIWILIRRQSFKINAQQCGRLCCLGILFALSSSFLFSAYGSIPSGIATTIVFLCPILVALIMCFFKVYPTWQVWISVVLTFIGVALLCQPDPAAAFHWSGILLAFLSALAYAFFIIIVNRSRALKGMSNILLTFYALLFGGIVFLLRADFQDFLKITDLKVGLCLLGLTLLPTLVSTITLAAATKRIGATQACVLGVFEPITAIGIGVLLFKEPLNFSIILGLFLTMFAIIFMAISESKAKSVT
ncbi:MAG: DMT family transporter [Proteobacteria bacterium]|nr:DMT family transporter [Pseudomonadota bacterium]